MFFSTQLTLWPANFPAIRYLAPASLGTPPRLRSRHGPQHSGVARQRQEAAAHVHHGGGGLAAPELAGAGPGAAAALL